MIYTTQEQLQTTDKKYQIIYADPPWVYKDKSLSRGGAERYYLCTPINNLMELKIPAENDSVCLMWVTYPQIPEGLKLMLAWGFTFKTVAFTWVKTSYSGNVLMGMGHYTRSNAEICLLGIKGKGVKRQSCGIRNTQLHQRLRHSEKPSAFRHDIQLLFGKATRLEMFARVEADGWDAFGYELSKMNGSKVEQRQICLL